MGLGNNDSGQLGIGNTDRAMEPQLISPTQFKGAAIVAIAAGGTQSLALDDQNHLWAWGYLGGQSSNRPQLVDISMLGQAKVTAIASGNRHNVVLDDHNRLWGWGGTDRGQLGIVEFNSGTPTLIDTSVLAGAKVQAISVGDAHNLLLDDQHRLWAWGESTSGQLGNASPEGVQLQPVDLAMLGSAVVTEIQAGANHNILIDSQNRVWAWGDDEYGQIGDGRIDGVDQPIPELIGTFGAGPVVATVALLPEATILMGPLHLWRGNYKT